MTAKEYLKQIEKLNILIEQKMSELSELRRYDGYTAVRLGGDGGGKKSTEAAFTRAVEKRVILEQKINSMIDEYVERKNTIIGQLHSLHNSVYIQILYKRYIEFKPLYRIAGEINYSYQHVKRMHGSALQSFAERWLTEQKATEKRQDDTA